MRSDNRVTDFGDQRPASHLSDDQLLEVYVVAGDHVHLQRCRQCRTRYDDLVRSMRHVREDALHEADQAFTSERLHDQRDRIMRRVERHDHPAEVVAFRTGEPPPRVSPSDAWPRPALGRGRRCRRLAAACSSVCDGPHADDTLAAPRGSRPSLALALQVADTDDQFLIEVEQALIGSRVREMRPDLGAIDLMTTPLEIREVSYVRE